jgi:IclR family transcriptional regulator, acetate operon repressor
VKSLPTTDDHDAVPRSIARVLDLLEAVVDAGDATLTAASQAVGLAPSTALRHLRALEARRYLSRDGNGVFSAGPALLRLAASTLDHGPNARLIAAAGPHLAALSAATGESAYLAVRVRDDATYVATSEGRHAIRHVGWVGKSVPLAGTAIGEALAGADGAIVRSGTVEPDVTAVAQAVRVRGEVVGAISVIGPTHRMTKQARAVSSAALGLAAAALAGELGGARVGVAS